MKILIKIGEIKIGIFYRLFCDIFEEEICDELLEELIEDPPEDIRSYRLLLDDEDLDEMIDYATTYLNSTKYNDKNEEARLVLAFANYFKELHKMYPDGITKTLMEEWQKQNEAALTKEEDKEE